MLFTHDLSVMGDSVNILKPKTRIYKVAKCDIIVPCTSLPAIRCQYIIWKTTDFIDLTAIKISFPLKKPTT